MSEYIEFRVIDIQAKANTNPNKDVHEWQYKDKIVAETEGGQILNFNRFRRTSDIPLAINEIYRAKLVRTKKAEEKGWLPLIEDVRYIETWGGIDNPFFPEPSIPPTPEQSEREASILAQSDIHTAVALVAAEMQKAQYSEAQIKDLIKKYIAIARQVRIETTEEYKEQK